MFLKKVEGAVKDKERMRKVIHLAISPIIYWFLYIWIIISRIVLLSVGHTPLPFVRYAVAVTIWIGFVNSIWFGYTRDIYVNTYYKIFSTWNPEQYTKSTVNSNTKSFQLN